METPESYQNSFCPQFTPEKRHSFDNTNNSKTVNGGGGGGDHFMVEDLLDFSNDDAVITDGGGVAFHSVTGNSTDSSSLTVIDSCNSSSLSGTEPNFAPDIGSRNLAEGPFSSDLCVPYDDLAELEWLSNFVEESFSSEDLQKLQLISGMQARPDEAASETGKFQPEPPNRNDTHNDNTTNNSPIFNPDVSVPAKARSKRSRAAPCNWTSRLLLLSNPTPSPDQSDAVVLASASAVQLSSSLPPPSSTGKKTVKSAPKKKESPDGSGGDGRKCLHCATDKTPQWRTGPMGPKTLCNACGVRYKSGRLVPEYRPVASPTFVLTKHSNSHRKVLELRRQKEMVRTEHQYVHPQVPPQHHQQHHHHHQNIIFDVSNGGDYLVHQHVGPDFRQLI